MRCADAGLRFAKVPDVLLRWRDHAGRLSRIDRRYRPDAFSRVKADALARGPLAGAAPVIIWGAGQTGRRLARHLLGSGVRIEAFVDIDDAKIGRSYRGAPTLPPSELAAHRDRFVLAAVAARGARRLIRERVCELGWQEGLDFWCTA